MNLTESQLWTVYLIGLAATYLLIPLYFRWAKRPMPNRVLGLEFAATIWPVLWLGCLVLALMALIATIIELFADKNP